jgi:RNA polymerase sigma factor for flagellar operon FliA
MSATVVGSSSSHDDEGCRPAPSSEAPGPIDRDDIVVSYLPRIEKLAKALARRLPPHVPLEDLVSAGAMGLLDAAGRYDPGRGERFDIYVEHRIRGAMLDELRSHDSLSRDLRSRSKRRDQAVTKLEREMGRAPSSEDVAGELGIEIEEYERLLDRVHRGTTISAEALTRDGSGAQAFADPTIPDPFKVVAARELRDLLARALASLPDRLQLVASLYYRDGLKLSEIGARLGVTEARACQLRGEAVRQLRSVLRAWEITADPL